MAEKCISLEVGEGTPHQFTDLLLDYTGTLSLDGVLLPGVAERLTSLARFLRITVLTADTFGKALEQLRDLSVTVHIIRTGEEKAEYMQGLEPERTIAIGNGRNDVPMMRLAGLAIAVMGPEGVAVDLLPHADILVADIRHALDLLLHPLRLKATLRS